MQAMFFKNQTEKVSFIQSLLDTYGNQQGCNINDFLVWCRIIDKETQRSLSLSGFTLEKLPDLLEKDRYIIEVITGIESE